MQDMVIVAANGVTISNRVDLHTHQKKSYACRILLVVVLLFMIQLVLMAQIGSDSLIVGSAGPGYYLISDDRSFPVVIPFTLHNGKPLMDVEINGIASKLMIDNGVLWDQVWLLGSPLVKQLGLKPIESSIIGGAGEGEPTEAFDAGYLTLKFSDITFFEQPVLVSPPSAGFAKAFPGADGQLCNTFFKHFIVEFDFIKHEIRLHNPEDYEYTRDGSVINMHRNENGTYSIPFSFTLPDGTSYSHLTDIDLGGIYPLKIALNNTFNIQPPDGAQPAFSYGVQGKSEEFSSVILSMKVGKYEFSNPPAIFGDGNTSLIYPGHLGVVGLPLFSKFDIVFDYFSNKIYINLNIEFHDPF